MITFQWDQPYCSFVEEAWPLISQHWDEVGSHRDVLHLNPDHDRYRALEKAGALNILTARVDTRLVGYMFILITRHPRDRDALAATDDILYVDPEYRHLLIGPKLLREAVKRCEARGVNIVFFREKAWRQGGGYLERYGFHPQEMVYAKVLKPPHGEVE